MKKLSKKELEAKVPGYAKAYPENEVFYATEDGNFFLEKDKRLADSHAKAKKVKLYPFEVSSSAEVSDDKSDEGTDEPINLSKLNKAELLELAEKHEIELEGKETNKELVALIEPKLSAE